MSDSFLPADWFTATPSERPEAERHRRRHPEHRDRRESPGETGEQAEERVAGALHVERHPEWTTGCLVVGGAHVSHLEELIESSDVLLLGEA